MTFKQLCHKTPSMILQLITMGFITFGVQPTKASEDYKPLISTCLQQSEANKVFHFNKNDTQKSIFGNPSVYIQNDGYLVLAASFHLIYQNDSDYYEQSLRQMELIKEYASRYLETYGIKTDFRFSHSIAGDMPAEGSVPVKWGEFVDYPIMTQTSWYLGMTDTEGVVLSEEKMMQAYLHEILHSFDLKDEYGDVNFGTQTNSDSIMANQWAESGPRLLPRHVLTILKPICPKLNLRSIKRKGS